jgi:putative transposase
MREPRIKISPEAGPADYQCTSKTVNGDRIFDDVAKEVLRAQIWQISDFCGVQILTHTVLENHFHVVLRVPQTTPVSDAELLRRYQVLYPKPTRYQTACLKVIAAQLETNGPKAVEWRTRQLRLMGDVSQYMKLLKQRFSIWYNRAHNRFGPLWADRFKSTLLGPGALIPMITYVDLNCVRAGIVQDPKEYRFCGYSEAVAGKSAARSGLQLAIGGSDWTAVQAAYRECLFGVGAKPRPGAATISAEAFEQVLAAGGQLPLADVLRCRIRYFTEGAVLGSRAFVLAQIGAPCRSKLHRPRAKPHPLPNWTNWPELTTLRAVRRRPVAK